MNKFGYLKIKNFCLSGDTIKKMKRYVRNWGNMFVILITRKDYNHKYKEFLPS